MQRFFGPFLWLPVLVTSSLFAQVPRIPFGGGFSGGPDGIKGDATFNLGRPIQLMANAPYSGEEKNESVQTLADGTHVTRMTPARSPKAWRDSQGRVRIEQPLGGGMANSSFKIPTLVQIEDPVAGYVYILDDINKVAHRLKVQVVEQRSMEPMMRRPAPVEGGGGQGGGGAMAPPAEVRAAVNPSPRPEMSAPVDLGTHLIDGVSVHGTRTTMVIPTGSQGNDGPISITREVWYSPELNLIIRTVQNDPRSGVQTNGIANLSRNNPDAGLFIVPSDYTTVDESGTFTIQWDTTGKQSGK